MPMWLKKSDKPIKIDSQKNPVMAANKDSYQLLIEKLDQFIRKYYVNQLIRGFLYSVALILALFLIFNVLEYNFYFDKGVRKGLFYSFIGASSLALIGWVFLPLLRYFRLGSVISHEQAADIIGDHFGNVKDKLLNVLQLKQQIGEVSNADLILASIDQKSEEINPVPFRSAIDLSKNRKYLRYALPPLLLLLVILFAAPSIIKDSTKRIINNNQEFEREAPFSFKLENDELRVKQFEDFPLTVTVEGEALPNEVFITIDNYQYRLNKENANTFSYRFSNVQKETEFNLFSSGVESEDFTLDVLLKPNITGFDIDLDFPSYTGRKDESLTSIGDIVVPVGTNINWLFNALHTDDIGMKFSSKTDLVAANRSGEQNFSYKKKAMRDETYKLYISNADLPNADSISYSITVVPDLHPTINVEKFVDSTDNKLLFFVGEASDDYGLLNLSFNYRITKYKGGQGQLQSIKLPKDNNRTVQYDYTWDLETLELAPGDELTYYFEVFDNDAVNGSKSAKTNIMTFDMPTLEEMEEKEDQNNEEIKDDLKKAKEESKKIKEDFKELREKMLQKEEMDWQTKKELEKLLERQKELENKMNQAKENFEENMKNQEEFSEVEEDIQEKQEKIQEMFEELMSDEMKELMQKIEEMLQEMEKDEALEMMEEMEMDDEELNMELDRMLELFKQLELEQEVQEQIDKLEELAEEQEKLAEETEKQEKSQEELKKEQEEINEKFEEIQEKMEEIEEKNEELENPMNLGDNEEDMEDIQEDLQDSQEQLQEMQNQKASESQKGASKKMKQMAGNMEMQMQGGQQEQMEEDMAALRQLLENLVALSFDQEDLIDYIGKTSVNTPRYVELVQDQYKLKDDFKMIEDSLHALSKRVFQIESFVIEKVGEVKHNMKESLTELEARKKPQAGEHQQFTMKHVNDLALMLSEVMNQMQQQMAAQMQGNQMCNNPGGQGNSGKVPKDKPGSKSQQSLGDQMKGMKERLEKEGKDGKNGSSKEFAEMAARQAALRKAMEQKQKEAREQGNGSEELQEIIDEMNKIETDLVNKRLTNEMLKRQEQIMTRLLKHEKAEREKEYDNKRKAEVGQDKEREMPPSLIEYIKKREAEIEMFKTVSPSLKPYYKFLVEEYFKELKTK